MAAVSDDDGSHGRSPVPRCAHHNEELKYHCRTCKEILCAQCTTAEKHRGHEIVLLDTAGVLALLSSDAGRLRAALPATTLAIDRLHTTSGDVGLEMERFFADLHALIDAKERECQRAFDTTREPLTTLRGAHQTAQRALEDAERIATQPVGSTQFGEALSVWRGVHDALVETERATAAAVPCRVVWTFSAPQLTEIRDAIARIPLPFLHFGVSFRDGPNYAVSGPHRNVLVKLDKNRWNAVASTALPGARAALKAGVQAAASAAAQETQQSVVQINEALGAWRGVRAAIAANERCAGLSVEARKVVWDGSTKEARDAVARVCAVRSSLDPPPLSGVSFRDGPNYEVSGPHRNVLKNTGAAGYNSTAKIENKPFGQLSGHVADGSIVEVEADTEHGTLSFIVNGKCGGITFEGLPADIVPVVITYDLQGDIVEVVWP